MESRKGFLIDNFAEFRFPAIPFSFSVCYPYLTFPREVCVPSFFSIQYFILFLFLYPIQSTSFHVPDHPSLILPPLKFFALWSSVHSHDCALPFALCWSWLTTYAWRLLISIKLVLFKIEEVTEISAVLVRFLKIMTCLHISIFVPCRSFRSWKIS